MKKIFIGIDFSKEKFDATLIKAEGVKECGSSVHEVFDNKTSGYRHSLVRQRVALTNRRSEKRLAIYLQAPHHRDKQGQSQV